MEDPALFAEDAERALGEAVEAALGDTDGPLQQHDYVRVLERLARVRPQVDAFFDQVMVNAEDPAVRGNRLALLKRLADRFGAVAAIGHLSASSFPGHGGPPARRARACRRSRYARPRAPAFRPPLHDPGILRRCRSPVASRPPSRSSSWPWRRRWRLPAAPSRRSRSTAWRGIRRSNRTCAWAWGSTTCSARNRANPAWSCCCSTPSATPGGHWSRSATTRR